MILEMVLRERDASGRLAAEYLIEQRLPDGGIFIREWILDPEDGRVILDGRTVPRTRALRILREAIR